jgi:menaquinone-dependent protoporphyrinogen oxidase
MPTKVHFRRVLVVYESRYGQTEKIADYCAELARGRADDVRVMHVTSVADNDLRDAEVTFVLSPVYYGHPPSSIRAFILRHKQRLVKGEAATAFFTVSGSGGSKRLTERQTARKTAHDFVASVGWQPSLIATFGGALAYPKYNFFMRFLAKTIAKKRGGPTDTTRVHESTDWTEVERATYTMLDAAARSERGMDGGAIKTAVAPASV